MSLLVQYEQQYASLIAEITAHIGRLQQQSSPNQRELCNQIDVNLQEAHELLEQMVLELRDLSASQRPSFTNKINVAQAELKRLQTEYKDTKDKLRTMNSAGNGALHTELDLAAGDYYEDVTIGNDQRQRLLENSERIERTGTRLTEGYRIALETETIGAQLLNDLHHQRETLQSARSRLRETNAELGRASRTLNTMLLRALREKVVLYGVGVCFVLAVGVTLYLTFAPTSTPTSS